MRNSRNLGLWLLAGAISLAALPALAQEGVEVAVTESVAPLPTSDNTAVVAVEVATTATAELPVADTAPAAKPAAEAVREGAPAIQPGIKVAGFNINGRFDLNYEIGNFENLPKDIHANQSFKNYHHLLFISRNLEAEPIFVAVEAIDLSFYEMGVKLPGRSSIKFGKIWVPFGADPLFHHQYGGLTGFDQKLLPFLWAELGASAKVPVYRNRLAMLSVDNETYLIAGITGEDDAALKLNGSSDAGRPAIGDRVRVSWEHYGLWGSFYWDRYAPGKDLVMWGLDAAANYGFLPWVSDLALKVGFMRADVRAADTLGNYYHFGDYLEAKYRLPKEFSLGYRTGAIAMENHQSLYFDRSRKTAEDTVSHSFTAYWRYRYLGVSLQYQINLEAANEVDNDLLRLAAVLEF